MKSAPLADFSTSELGNWFAEFALNSVLQIFDFYFFLMNSEVGSGIVDFTLTELSNGFVEFNQNSLRQCADMKIDFFINLKIFKNYRNTFSFIKFDIGLHF